MEFLGLAVVLLLVVHFGAQLYMEWREASRRERILEIERDPGREEGVDSPDPSGRQASTTAQASEDMRELTQEIERYRPDLRRGMIKNSIVAFPLFFLSFVLLAVFFFVDNKTIAISTLVVALSCSGAAKFYFYPRACSFASRLNNLEESSGHRKDLESLIVNNMRFAFYLRDFWSSSAIKLSRSRPFIGVIESTRNPTEDRVASLLSDWLPVYALHNHWDSNPFVATRRVLTTEDIWFNDFARYATKAMLIVIDAHILSAGLKREIDFIQGNMLNAKSLLLATNEELDTIALEYPSLSAGWIIKLQERDYFNTPDFQLPDPLVSELNEVIGERACGMQGYEKLSLVSRNEDPGAKLGAIFDPRARK